MFGPLFGAVAGLFDELALGGVAGGFAGVNAAGGQFEEKLVGSVAELLLEYEERVTGIGGLIDREDDDGAVVADHVAGGADAVGLLDFFGVDGEDFAVKAFVRREDVGLALLEFGSSDGKLGHLR